MYDSERSSFKVEVRMLNQRIAELEAKVERLEAERRELQVLVDCLPILIYRLKELGERETLEKWDLARAALQEGE